MILFYILSLIEDNALAYCAGSGQAGWKERGYGFRQ